VRLVAVLPGLVPDVERVLVRGCRRRRQWRQLVLGLRRTRSRRDVVLARDHRQLASLVRWRWRGRVRRRLVRRRRRRGRRRLLEADGPPRAPDGTLRAWVLSKRWKT